MAFTTLNDRGRERLAEAARALLEAVKRGECQPQPMELFVFADLCDRAGLTVECDQLEQLIDSAAIAPLRRLT